MTNHLIILDVGHGNSAIISDISTTAIIDATNANMLLESLIQLKISNINYIFISHADEDHIRGINDIIMSTYINRIDYIYIHPDSQKNTEVFEDLMIALEYTHTTRNTTILTINNSLQGIAINNDYALSIKYPSITSSLTMGKGLNTKNISNALSMVISVDLNKESIALFCGDIDQSSLDEMIKNRYLCKTKYLVFPHHGGNCGKSKTENIKFTEDLINSCTPETVVFSLGRNKYKNPRIEIINKIKSMNTNIKIMCTQISKNCLHTLPNYNQQLVGFPSIGRINFLSCAGTIHIYHDGINWNLSNSMHHQFIVQYIPNRKC